MRYSSSVHGPWKQAPGVVLQPAPAGAWDNFVTNPSLYFFPNGTALMAYRGGPCLDRAKGCDAHNCAMAAASSWDSQFQRLGSNPAWEQQTEDPGIFRDERGNFHILSHLFAGGPGGHSYSADGVTWHFAGQVSKYSVLAGVEM